MIDSGDEEDGTSTPEEISERKTCATACLERIACLLVILWEVLYASRQLLGYGFVVLVTIAANSIYLITQELDFHSAQMYSFMAGAVATILVILISEVNSSYATEYNGIPNGDNNWLSMPFSRINTLHISSIFSFAVVLNLVVIAALSILKLNDLCPHSKGGDCQIIHT